ncbi:N-acetylmuramoyl-L-alanine amidase [Terrisporobacter mayombei]|uniref:MurNAc-LAA domain-containing protein n=1 Tax=Terrisporobacter mayombei TaxID=1541 RepID=A0ABY9PW53_9FIRM|nr:N-acetylmuramoyl-L-alanine amidase [Terrisporobacter mayombei]MCC3870300.1 N-acetylmuramoyl-L-alanine amidase [Terrisporobacter mayombei]WMT79925.1 hypothetical protein TEMA_01960 [Terrisporobacter mayombei]
MAKYLVGIDAGHGMNTEGKRTPVLTEDLYIDGKLVKKKGQCIHEFEWNIGVSEYLAKALERCGIDYIYLMDKDSSTDTPLSTRASKANKTKCDIVVSDHYNAFGGCSSFLDRKGGLLVLRTQNCSSKSIKLGELVANQLEEDIDYGYSYGLRKDVDISGFTLGILRQTNMPAILIEYGFMDVLKEAKLMLDAKYQKKCAESVCKAICKYFGVAYKKESTPTTSNKTKFKIKVLSNTLNVRKIADWNTDPVTKVKKGQWLEVVAEVDAKNGKTNMYKLESGLYITTSPKYVEIVK